jgi:hypothetical protein
VIRLWPVAKLLITASIIAVLAALSGCGSSRPKLRVVNPARVSTAIAASVRRERHVSATITCPTGVPLKARTQFYCVAQRGAQITPFRVLQTDGSGDISFVGVDPRSAPMLGTAVVSKAIAASIRRSGNVRPAVQCPEGMPRQRGLSFVCSATIVGHKPILFKVTQVDNDGHVRYQEM